MERRTYAKCFICRCRPSLFIKGVQKAIFLCGACEHEFFSDLFTDEEKLNRLLEAMKMAQKHKIGIGIALNVQKGRYGLDEAKRRARLKEREAQGKSVDAFAIGIRRPGSLK